MGLAKLQLPDDCEFIGHSIGVENGVRGELVFTTAMVGYSEALTDPSYCSQILVFSYPMMGNYGVPSLARNGILSVGFESAKIQVAGVVFDSLSLHFSHFDATRSLGAWLIEQKIPTIVGVDTRELIRKLRVEKRIIGSMVFNNQVDFSSRNSSDFHLSNLLPKVSIKEPKIYGAGRRRIGVIDCGVKHSLIRILLEHDIEVLQCPWNADFLNIDCDGWVISNGPGDPSKTEGLPKAVMALMNNQNRPILGICLGHQIMALASGLTTRSMKFGHRSHNQPVKDLATGKGYITSQNHGYEVCLDSLGNDWCLSFQNLNDGSVEGIRHRFLPFEGVQFHPEAAGGPRDTRWILDRFVERVCKT